MSRIFQRYLEFDYLTPGAEDTVGLIREHFGITNESLLLEIACGKGTTAVALAGEYGCSIVGVDFHPAFAKYAAARARERGLDPSINFVRGDGGVLPVRDGAFDGAICIGGPSIVGTERCLAAMQRALKPGSMIGISDWTWRTTAPPPEAVPAGVKPPFVTTQAYAEKITAAGFEIIHGEPMPQSAWNDYYAQIRPIIAEVRAETPDAPEDVIESEVKAYDAGGHLWAYSAFIARKK